MQSGDYFWSASSEELKDGYLYDKDTKAFVCLICSKKFEKSMVYPIGDGLYKARKAVELHIAESHGTMFEYLLDMGKVYTGLTEHQRNLMRMFYKGDSDKEIVQKSNATNTSTIRNQRFVMREKYKQAKIIVAIMELLEEKREGHKMKDEKLVDIHRTATMIDERYAITASEKEDVLKRYFDKNDSLVIKTFPSKEKKKIIILQHLMERFEVDRRYSEKEVNAIINNVYEDIPTIRRYLIAYGFLDRTDDGREYWVKQ